MFKLQENGTTMLDAIREIDPQREK